MSFYDFIRKNIKKNFLFQKKKLFFEKVIKPKKLNPKIHMKKNAKNLLFACLFAGFYLFSQTSYAQCDTETYRQLCIKKIPEYFVYSKNFPLSKKETEVEVFLTQLKAYIVLSDSFRTRIEIYKDNGKGVKTLIKASNGFASYVVPTTGKYFFKFVFDEDTEESCGSAVLAFLR